MIDKFNTIIGTLDSYIGGSSWFIVLLLGTGIFFTIYLKFPQFRFLKLAIKILTGKFAPDRGGDGETTHFQALSTALSGTVGTGNIAGVAFAIHLGGPAALFWMLVTALVGMCTKFVEVTLSHKYREKAEDGTSAGGPMYFMKNGLNMKWLAAIFAVATILSSFGTGSLPQINSISNAVYSTWGVERYITGAVLALLLALVIMGGIKRIAQVTSKLVPAMSVIYFIGSLAVILYNFDNIIPSITSIFSDVFTGSSATGGFLGASISFAINRGINRGLFSNESGQGSAPIAHASAKTEDPVTEGLVALLEPFIDTIIICSLTGLVLLSSGVWNEKIENQFQPTDTVVLSEVMTDSSSEDIERLSAFIIGEGDVEKYSGTLDVVNGEILNKLTVIHARSIAEDITVLTDNKSNYSGQLNVVDGTIIDQKEYVIEGRSLIHSAPLTAEAFSRSWFGDFGKHIVTLGILLFAFSTAISWSYYGNIAVTYLWGSKAVIWYRVVYIAGFFIASFADTTIIWTLSGIAIALMTIPNLIGILLLRKDMKGELNRFTKTHL